MQREYKLGFQCYRCCSISVSLLSSVRASISLLRSSIARGPHRAAEEVPHLPSPTLTLSRGAGIPRQNHPTLPLPTTALGCISLFPFPMQEASNPGESGETKNQTATSVLQRHFPLRPLPVDFQQQSQLWKALLSTIIQNPTVHGQK